MSVQKEDIWPILKPAKLPETAAYDYGVWFIFSDITGSEDVASTPSKKNSLGSKIKSFVKDNTPNATYGSDGDLLVVPISMSTAEYDSHFATDEESGEYLSGVAEPPGGRVAWLKQRFEEQQPKARKIREVSGFATKANAAYAGPVGVAPGGGGGL